MGRVLLGRGQDTAKHLPMHRTAPQQRTTWPQVLEVPRRRNSAETRLRGILGLERSFCDLRDNVGSGVARSKDRSNVRNDICPSLWGGTGVHVVFPK